MQALVWQGLSFLLLVAEPCKSCTLHALRHSSCYMLYMCWDASRFVAQYSLVGLHGSRCGQAGCMLCQALK